MKTLLMTILCLPLVLIGIHQVHSKGMEQKTDDMGMSQSMKVDTMMKSKNMKEDSMMKSERKYIVPTDEELRQRLTPLQYRVTREDGTEMAFSNTYWNNHEAGLYVDVISGAPLFSSLDKYESGTGWPSFTKPLDPEQVIEKTDTSLFSVRTEVRSKLSDAHLGHVFDDGPAPGGLRYCMNSASLRFIPVADLEKEGYGEYVEMFKK